MHWFDWEWKDSTGGGVWGGRDRGFGGKLPFMAYLGRLRPKEVPFSGKEICHFPGSYPGVNTICGLSLLLVLSLAPRGFSPGTLVFPSPQKPTFPNSNSIRNRVDEEPLCGCATSKLLLLLLLLLLFHDCEKVEKMFWFCDFFMIKVHLQQSEGMQRSRYVKEVLLIVNWRYMKGVPFLSLIIYKRVRGWTLGWSLPAFLPQLRKKINWNYHLQLSIIMNTATD